MAIFGGKRDAAMFRQINRELIKKIVQSEVDIIKVSVEDTPSNLYGESLHKYYYQDVRLACLIKLNNRETKDVEYGTDIDQICRFSFLRDDLVKANIFLETGDMIDWNGRIWEIDKKIEDSLFMSRNPDYNKTINEYDYNDLPEHTFGWNVSVIVDAHLTRNTKTNLIQTNSGNPEGLY